MSRVATRSTQIDPMPAVANGSFATTVYALRSSGSLDSHPLVDAGTVALRVASLKEVVTTEP